MDSEHRHELKQNDFVVYAKKIPFYLKKHWWESICVVIIIVALVMQFSKGRTSRPDMTKQKEVTAVYQDIAAAKGGAVNEDGSIEELEELINELLEKSKDLEGAQQALAKIKAGDAIRAKLHYSDEMVSQEDIESHTVEAISMYEKAIEAAEGNMNTEALAKFGIALAKEDASKFDEAANLYGQIIANSSYENTSVVKLAKDKLDGIAMAKEQFEFVEPEPEELVEDDGDNETTEGTAD